MPLLADKSARIVAYSPDGITAAVVSHNEIELLKLGGYWRYDQPIILAEQTETPDKVAFSPRGHYIIATVKEDNLVRFWDAGTGQAPVPPIDAKAGGTLAVFSPDDKYLATTQNDGTLITVRSLKDPTRSVSIPWKDADGSKGTHITSLAFNRDASLIVTTAAGENVARVWDAQTGELKQTLRGHACQVNTAEFYNPTDRGHENQNSADQSQGEQIVTAGDDGATFVWDARRGKIEHELRGHRQLIISRHTDDGSRHPNHGIPRWLEPFDIEYRHREGGYVPINTAKFSHDGRKVVTTSVDGRVLVWTWKDKKRFATALELKGYTGNVLSAEFSPDDKFIIAAGQDGAARVWRLPSDPPSNQEAPSQSAPKAQKIARKCEAASQLREKAANQ